MHTTMFVRRALAIPAVLTLALGGALISTTSAQAVDGAVTISTPATDGAQLDTRYVTFEGTALDGSTVEVYQGDVDGTLLGSTTATGGSWSLEYDYTDEDTDAQQIAVTGADATGETFDETVTRSFSMPTAGPVLLESPATADVLTTRTATFVGSASPGSVVSFSDFDTLEVLATADVGADGRFTVDYTFADDADENQAILFEGSAWSGFDVRQFVLPAVVTPPTTPVTLPAPVITAPTQGSTVTGTEVTFEGTGTPGADIGLLVTPTDTVSTLADDPAARIIVDENGDWTVTLALQPADYTAVAVQVLLDAADQPVVDENGLPVVSDDSTPVDFTLEAEPLVPFASPVVTSPAAGQAVVGSTLTVTGTGTPGARVAFVLFPQGGAPASSGPFEDAQAESTIVVDAAGNWTSTVTGVRPGAYTIAPFSFALNAEGVTTAIALGDPVDFTVVAAVVTAAAPTTPTGLAYTGSEGTETAAGIGAAALLAGALLLIAARRRAKLAVAETPAE